MSISCDGAAARHWHVAAPHSPSLFGPSLLPPAALPLLPGTLHFRPPATHPLPHSLTLSPHSMAATLCCAVLCRRAACWTVRLPPAAPPCTWLTAAWTCCLPCSARTCAACAAGRVSLLAALQQLWCSAVGASRGMVWWDREREVTGAGGRQRGFTLAIVRQQESGSLRCILHFTQAPVLPFPQYHCPALHCPALSCTCRCCRSLCRECGVDVGCRQPGSAGHLVWTHAHQVAGRGGWQGAGRWRVGGTQAKGGQSGLLRRGGEGGCTQGVVAGGPEEGGVWPLRSSCTARML